MSLGTQDDSEQIRKLYLKAIELLSRREHSAAELHSKLSRRFSDIDDLDAKIWTLITRLQESGYQSDQRFAESYVRSRLSANFGKKRIAMELNQKGIASEAAEEALAEVFDAESVDELSQLENLWQKKFGRLPEDAKSRAKQMRFLVGRGFSFDQIQRLFDRIST